MQNIEIKPSTPIEVLRNTGIVPDWMAKDCEQHGIYELSTPSSDIEATKPLPHSQDGDKISPVLQTCSFLKLKTQD